MSGKNPHKVTESHQYYSGRFPRRLLMGNEVLPVVVNSNSLRIGCTTFHRPVLENLLEEMDNGARKLADTLVENPS